MKHKLVVPLCTLLMSLICSGCGIEQDNNKVEFEHSIATITEHKDIDILKVSVTSEYVDNYVIDTFSFTAYSDTDISNSILLHSGSTRLTSKKYLGEVESVYCEDSSSIYRYKTDITFTGVNDLTCVTCQFYSNVNVLKIDRNTIDVTTKDK